MPLLGFFARSIFFLLFFTNTCALSDTPRSLFCPVVLPQDPPSKLSILINPFNISEQSPQRIINGDIAPISLQNYLVSILISPSPNFSYLCTGTLISATQFITAAHCYHPEASIFASIGNPRSLGYDPHQKRIPVEKFEIHPEYSSKDGTKHDIAVITLAEKAQNSALFMKVNMNVQHPLDGSFVRAIGYGATKNDPAEETFEESGFLRQVDVPVTREETCKEAYAGKAAVIDYNIHVCAGYSKGGCDSCQGDSGGPIIQYDSKNEPVLVGVTSFGFECARPGFPGVYVRIARYSAWLNSINADYQKTRKVVPVFGPGSDIPEPIPSVSVTPLPDSKPSEIPEDTNNPGLEDNDDGTPAAGADGSSPEETEGIEESPDLDASTSGLSSSDASAVVITVVGALAAALIGLGITGGVILLAKRAVGQRMGFEGKAEDAVVYEEISP